jgi:single-stranded DNA-specific DHH superfamily exonuclease
MACYDIFNGDADGICALHQLRLTDPRATELITGTKREIRLVERCPVASGDELTVLDISFDSNRQAVSRALNAGARVRYFDHHYAGEIPQHPELEAHIDTAANVCTSLLVDRALAGRHRVWAVVAAFGDNLAESALHAAAPLAHTGQELAQLRDLGECLNYNAYGESVDDLHYHPADLYRVMSAYADPYRFITDEPVFEVLRQGMADDLYRASETKAQSATERHAVIVLPDASWSRRVAGILGNKLAAEHPARAHAVLTARAGGYLVSVRAPIQQPRGAEQLCRQFETGGGRAGAAGINHLPQADFDRFVRAFMAAFAASSA